MELFAFVSVLALSLVIALAAAAAVLAGVFFLITRSARVVYASRNGDVGSGSFFPEAVNSATAVM